MPADSIKILAFSDSTDTHVLNYYLETLLRRLGNSTPGFNRVFNNSRIVLHERAPRLNHAITNSGLTLFQMFIMGVDQRQKDHAERILATRQQFDELMPPLTNGGPHQQPDLIVFHVNHWTLKFITEGYGVNFEGAELEVAAQLALPPDFIAAWERNLTIIARQIRQAFPNVLMVYHTSCMVRHNTDTGGSFDGRRTWVNKMFVAQLNAAGRSVARKLRMPLVDWEIITQGLIPSQVLFDDIHPPDWVLYEFYNILLNLHDDHKHGRTHPMHAVSTPQ